jgi:hypothetical protein
VWLTLFRQPILNMLKGMMRNLQGQVKLLTRLLCLALIFDVMRKERATYSRYY